MTTKTYTEEQKAEVLELWPQVGTTETERRTGVGHRTIIRWANEAGLMSRDNAQKVQEATEAGSRVSNAWADFRSQEALAAGAAANRMRREALEASTERNASLLRARVVAYGIFIDKAELLSGQATQRIQVWAESEIDRDLREAMAELEDRIRVGEN
jgi:hypothetical protein